MLDLEHRFKLVQEEKQRLDRDAQEREELHAKKSDNLQADARILRTSLNEKEADLQKTRASIASYRALADEKSYQVEQLKKDIAQYEADNAALRLQKRGVEGDLAQARETRKTAEAEVDHLLRLNDQLTKKQAETETRLRESELELARLSRTLEAAEAERARAERDVAQAEKDLDIARDSRRLNQAEVDKQLALNNRLQNEKAGLVQRQQDLEAQVLRTGQKLDDSMAFLAAKEKELRSIRASTSIAEDKGAAASEELRKAQKDNESLHLLLDKYRDDVDFQRKLREEEALRKLQLEDEKKRLENEALAKSIEARSAKRQLEAVQDQHVQLIDQKGQLANELDALKHHANLLESQNFTVTALYDLVAPQGTRQLRRHQRAGTSRTRPQRPRRLHQEQERRGVPAVHRQSPHLPIAHSLSLQVPLQVPL